MVTLGASPVAGVRLGARGGAGTAGRRVQVRSMAVDAARAQKLRAIFDAYDADKDALLSRDEVAGAVTDALLRVDQSVLGTGSKRKGLALMQETPDSVMRRLDKSGSAVVNFDEFCSLDADVRNNLVEGKWFSGRLVWEYSMACAAICALVLSGLSLSVPAGSAAVDAGLQAILRKVDLWICGAFAFDFFMRYFEPSKGVAKKKNFDKESRMVLPMLAEIGAFVPLFLAPPLRLLHLVRIARVVQLTRVLTGVERPEGKKFRTFRASAGVDSWTFLIAAFTAGGVGIRILEAANPVSPFGVPIQAALWTLSNLAIAGPQAFGLPFAPATAAGAALGVALKAFGALNVAFLAFNHSILFKEMAAKREAKKAVLY